MGILNFTFLTAIQIHSPLKLAYYNVQISSIQDKMDLSIDVPNVKETV